MFRNAQACSRQTFLLSTILRINIALNKITQSIAYPSTPPKYILLTMVTYNFINGKVVVLRNQNKHDFYSFRQQIYREDVFTPRERGIDCLSAGCHCQLLSRRIVLRNNLLIITLFTLVTWLINKKHNTKIIQHNIKNNRIIAELIKYDPHYYVRQE